MDAFRPIRRDQPANYTPPAFPSLVWPPDEEDKALYELHDIWRFTLLWTLIIYAVFHLGAASIALLMQVGKKGSKWKYLWLLPLLYLGVAGIEALFAGTVVGLVIGGVYKSGDFAMSTWIPFIWGWVNVLVLIISSFSIQGGL